MDVQALRDVVARKEPAFLAGLEAMVNVDCGSYTPDGVNAIADRCEEMFRDGGWEVERRSHVSSEGDPRLGDLVIGRITGDGGPNVLLVGHMDTVFDDGTVAERPFRIEGSRAFGPGVSDMKGGLLAGFVAVAALRDAGFGGFGTITYVCNPDEEIGSPFSGPVIRELAPAHDVAFVLECARANGDIVSARKGVTDYVVVFSGRAAHAGVEPQKGRHAVLAAAHATVALQALNGRWPGVTVNVGLARGGTRPNVVPERAVLEVDLRAVTADAQDIAEREIAEVLAAPAVNGVTIDARSEGTHRPMEKGDATVRLVEQARSIAGELGFALTDTATGGASDGNTTSAAGTPTLDGLGPIGGGAHADDEWLDLDSVVPRITMLAGLMGRL
jgi:glutamate carboxypeptidase